MHPRSNPQTPETELSFEQMLQMMFGITIARPASYKDLTEQLNHFLLPHGINIKCCDVFEETLLNEAGVTTQPTKCIFASAGDTAGQLMGFHFEGITYDDLLKFASYYNKHASQQSDVEMQFDKETGTGRIIVDVNVVYNKLLPAFKSAFSNIPREKLDHYSDLSKKDDDVVDYNLLQSILVLINSTVQMTEDKLKAGMLIILNEQLKNVIDEYRKHQLHECEMHTASLTALGKELGNFHHQSHLHSVLRDDSNIQSVNALIHEYVNIQRLKSLKATFGEAAVAAAQAAANDDASSTAESTSPSSESISEPASPRSDSPLRSVARLFTTPPSTPSLSRSGSTASLPGSDTSTELYNSSDFDIGSEDIFADEPDFVPLRSIRFV